MRSVSPQPSLTSDKDTDISFWERCVSESLLENGTEDKQLKASAGGRVLFEGFGHIVNALNTDNNVFCARAVRGVSSPEDQLSLVESRLGDSRSRWRV